MELQADLIGVPVEVSADADATALGAAALAGLAVGSGHVDALVPMLRRGARYEPSLDPGRRSSRLVRAGVYAQSLGGWILR